MVLEKLLNNLNESLNEQDRLNQKILETLNKLSKEILN